MPCIISYSPHKRDTYNSEPLIDSNVQSLATYHEAFLSSSSSSFHDLSMSKRTSLHPFGPSNHDFYRTRLQMIQQRLHLRKADIHFPLIDEILRSSRDPQALNTRLKLALTTKLSELYAWTRTPRSSKRGTVLAGDFETTEIR